MKILIKFWNHLKCHPKKYIAIALFIFISNTFWVKVIYQTIDQNHYKFSNYNGSFTSIVFLDRDYEMTTGTYEHFLKVYPNISDKNLYRTFWRNPLCYWRWGEYFTDTIYNHPYKGWKEIRKLRGYDLKNSNNFQEF